MSELRRLLADNRLVRPKPKSKAKTQKQIAKRDRLIVAMAAEGKKQRQIADELDVPRKTVSNVLARTGRNNGAVKMAKPLPEIPDLFAKEPSDESTAAEPAAAEPAAPVKKRTGRSPSKIRKLRHANELTPRLRELAPAAFCTPPRPLALGITDELVPLVAGASRSAISHAVSVWCGRTIYLVEALANGGARIALDGTERGQVSDEHRDSATQRLAARQAADAAAVAAYRARRKPQSPQDDQ